MIGRRTCVPPTEFVGGSHGAISDGPTFPAVPARIGLPFFRPRVFGTIEAGKRADIVLLDANPLDDIRNTRKIHAVIVGGRFFSRTELVHMVDRAVRDR